MKLSDIAKKPQLVKIVMDSADIVKEFGEPLEFWSYDRQPMDVFIRLSSVDPENQSAIINSVRELVLDESGKPILSGDLVLPTWVLMKVMTKVVEGLGK